MHIAVVGAGNVGSALTHGWLKAGHEVTVAVRDTANPKAAELARAGAKVATPADAAKRAEVIVLAVPAGAIEAAVKGLGPLAGKLVIDTTNPLGPGFTLTMGHTDSAGELVARLAPGARVVKAFNMTGASNMLDAAYPGGKLMMAVAGDDDAAKQTVMGLAADLGFDPVDTGPLSMSRYLEPMAMVWIKCAAVQKMGRDFGFALLRR